MGVPPSIETSTRDERLAFVQHQWECMHNCELWGKCHMLHGKKGEDADADYMTGKRAYRELTLEPRS